MHPPKIRSTVIDQTVMKHSVEGCNYSCIQEPEAMETGRTALELAIWSSQPKMVQLLINEDFSEYDEEDLMKCYHDLLHTITISCFSNINEAKVRIPEEQGQMNCEPIITIARSLINSSKFDENDHDVDSQNLLHRLLKGHIKKSHIYFLLQLLLVKGVDFNAKDSSGLTPLMITSKHGYAPAIKILFDWEHKSRMKLDMDSRDDLGETALIKAVERYHVEVVRLLLSHKASVNVHDYCGFTALHAAICEPNENLRDLHFFCDGLRRRNFEIANSPELGINLTETLVQLNKFVEDDKRRSQIQQEIVELLLANEETDVNAIDFRGRSPLDLAVKSSRSEVNIFALRNRGAIRTLIEPEARIEVNIVDERGRNPIHRLIISRISCEVNNNIRRSVRNQCREQFDLMLRGIYLRQWKFKELATASDSKGRTPLHYAAMYPIYEDLLDSHLLTMFVGLGSNVNEADMHRKTPLHYAEFDPHYELLVKHGADENASDKYGFTPEVLKQLRESVKMNEENAKKMSLEINVLYLPDESLPMVQADHATELMTKQKLVDAIRSYSQSIWSQEWLEKVIWKAWTRNELVCLNRRQRQLKLLVHQFIVRLADGIRKKDSRFECQPTLVGSADEETKIVTSADFDFNFQLNKFNRLCDPLPHPWGPNGYFKLRRKSSTENTIRRSDETFDCFFNSDQCLLTNEVNCRFQILLQEVLSEVAFWKDEDLFELYEFYEPKSKSKHPDWLCKNVLLKMLRPIEDGLDGHLFDSISIDVVACVHVEGWWPDDTLPVGIDPSVKADGCTLVFDCPGFYPTSCDDAHFYFSDTFARISFAPLESRLIKESPPLMRAAYMVCKMILYSQRKTTYQLKTCLLFCMDALNVRNGGERNSENEITPTELVFWVERIMFCFREFDRHEAFLCYFMPSFTQKTHEFEYDYGQLEDPNPDF